MNKNGKLDNEQQEQHSNTMANTEFLENIANNVLFTLNETLTAKVERESHNMWLIHMEDSNSAIHLELMWRDDTWMSCILELRDITNKRKVAIMNALMDSFPDDGPIVDDDGDVDMA